ncbi:MAG: HK97 family phage prohead protease, partial [Actinobacteria bacterium]|nr:HK97 family phage prohead protease [Actinomycetota bacterium]
MSFGFIVPEGGDDWDMSDPENPIRILKRVILWDISPVTYPAYPQTSVGIRTAKQVYDDFLSKRMQEQKLDENNAKYQERKAKLRKIKLELTKG